MSSLTLPPPVIIPRPEHTLSRTQISANALRVLYRLKHSGYAAYLVGGAVRDLLLGHTPKDFDVATNATPEQVHAVFHNCRLIGRRFRLAHVVFGDEIVEVATFRAAGQPHTADGTDDDDGAAPPISRRQRHHSAPARQLANGMIVSDNVYGSIAEDALRRDFTINAIYYNIDDFSLVDYTAGLTDLIAKRLRLIGDDPVARYREDPVRMLRAVRFQCKLGFTLDPDCETPLQQLAPLLHEVSAARLFEEVLKLFHTGAALPVFEQLRHYGLFAALFPATAASINNTANPAALAMVQRGLANTDQRLHDAKSVTPCFLFAVLLWPPVQQRYQQLLARGHAPADAMAKAAAEITLAQQRYIAMPRRFSLPMRDIWLMQPRLERQRNKRATVLLTNPRLRAAYDFLLLRAAAGEADIDHMAQWWTQFLHADANERAQLATAVKRKKSRRRRRAPAEITNE